MSAVTRDLAHELAAALAHVRFLRRALGDERQSLWRDVALSVSSEEALAQINEGLAEAHAATAAALARAAELETSLDNLLAENERLREALRCIDDGNNSPDAMTAREALAPPTASTEGEFYSPEELEAIRADLRAVNEEAAAAVEAARAARPETEGEKRRQERIAALRAASTEGEGNG